MSCKSFSSGANLATAATLSSLLLLLFCGGCSGFVTEGSSPHGPTSLQISVTALPPGTLTAPYTASLGATGGTTPYSWAISSGALPAGLTLSSGGQISGTPTTAGTFSFTVKVSDSGSPAQTATADLSITVDSSSSANCPTGQPCGATAPFCETYTPPSTFGATPISALPYIIKSSGNYYLTSSLSVPAGGLVGISIQASDVDINLNGYTLTYGAGGSSATSAVGQYGIIACDTGNLGSEQLASSYGSNGYCSSTDHTNITIENGTITQSASASGYDNFANCPGASVGGNYSPNPCAPGGNDDDPYAPTFSHNIFLFNGQSDHITHVILNFQQVSSDGIIDLPATGGDTIECNTFNNGDVHIDNRAMIEGLAIFAAAYSGSGDTIQYNTIVGGPQGGILSSTSGSSINNNNINIGVGSSGQVQYTNDFAIYAWGLNNVTVANNYIHNAEGRGVQDYWTTGQSNLSFSGNYISTVEYPNNYEYNTATGSHPGCAWLGSTGPQFRGGGNIAMSGMTVSVNAGACPGAGLQDYGWGPTTSTGTTYAAHAITGFTGGSSTFEYEATPLWIFSGSGDSASSFTSTGDTFIGDSSVFYMDYPGLVTGQTITLISPTLSKGANPVNFNTFRFWNDGGNVCSGCIHIRDAKFTNGASATDVDMTYPIDYGYLAEYWIDWTYTLTVTNGSDPLSGAEVTIQDALGKAAFTGTTNANGQISAVLTQFRMYSGTSAPVQENHTPDSITVSASGCTTLNYTVTVTGTTADSRTLTCQ